MTDTATDPISVARDFASTLADWAPHSPELERLGNEYIGFLRTSEGAALDRDGGPEHLTASCFVFSQDLSRVLLCFHRKGRFWVQLGGHIEADDASVAAAAFREAREESGLNDLRPSGVAPFDLHKHQLGGGFVRCTAHWDVGFVAIAPTDAPPIVSSESEAVAWWPVDRLPDGIADGFEDRMRTVLRELECRVG